MRRGGGRFPGGRCVLVRRGEVWLVLPLSGALQALAWPRLRSRCCVRLGRYEDALVALDAATGLVPERSEAWLLKATLLRRMDRLAPAQEAIEQAARLAPTNPEIGLEAGVIAVLSGRDEAARQSWQSVIELQPESLAAATAKDYLDQLGPAETMPAPPTPTPTPTPTKEEPSV